MLKIREDAERDRIESPPVAKKQSLEKDQRSDTGFALPSEFWSSFVEHHWQRHPLVIKQPFTRLLASPSQIFQALVDSSDQFRAGDERFPQGFYFDHASLLTDMGKFLPEASDESLTTYAERITAQLQGRQFGLIVEEVHARNAILWLRLREFLRPLYELVGIPAENAKATVFLGNYEQTPFGLHQGESENFQFVIAGRKRLRVWPPEFFRDREDVSHTLDYERFLEGSIELKGDPGDLLYWPSGYWHIGEAVNKEIVLALSVALFMNAQPVDDIIKHAGRAIERRFNREKVPTPRRVFPGNLFTSTHEVIPKTLEMATETLVELDRDPEFAQDLKLSLLNRITGFGFNNVPPAQVPSELNEEDVVRRAPNSLIVWMDWEDDQVVCSANGHGFSVLGHPKVIRLLESLNAGKESTVKTLVQDHSGTVSIDGVDFEASSEAILALLEKLYSLRALEIVTRHTSSAERE